MSYLVDTNVLSELRKGQRCDPAVAAWYASVPADGLYISALVLGEIRKGVALLERRDPAQAQVFDTWLAELSAGFADRILAVDVRVADCWGRLEARGPFPVEDGLMAATAIVHDLTFVSRNVADVADSGARLLDPWRHT